MTEHVALEISNLGVPLGMLRGKRRYRVTDVPTLLEMEYSVMTHPLPDLHGWRFQGTAEDGETLVFDVRLDVANNEWVLIHCYA